MSAAEATAGPPPMKLPLWTRGDLNAFFGLGINMLVNVIVLAGLAAFVVQIPADDVYKVILPALGIELLVGNIFYFYLAKKLAEKEGRTNVTAMPYGPSVPHMFIVTFVVMLPTFIATKDPIKAWTAGLAWAFIIGIIILIGAFVGPTIRKFTPRAALLGTLAGISITFISMRPAAQMWEAAWIALPVLAMIVIGFVAGVQLPGNFPMGLAALLLGSALAWAGGFMETAAVTDAAKQIAVGIPNLEIGKLIDGLEGISPLLATAIPLGIYNFTEAMSNVESAAAAGDKYNLRQILLADGTGAIIGSALGSPFPPAVYVGHPGWKKAGGTISYSLATGVVIFLLCVFGMFPLLGAILPVPAIVPILLFIGLVIGAQAFGAVPKAHYAAIVLAIVPNVAAWASGLIDNTIATAQAAAAAAKVPALEITDAALATNGVIHLGLTKLGEGAVLAGMLLGAIGVFMIDRRFLWAAGYSFLAAILCCFGLIHGAKVSLDFDSIQLKLALGYALMGVVCLAFSRMGIPEREIDIGDPVDIEDYAERTALSKPLKIPDEEPELQPA
jgi:AGZA family xanthine/uracil permease-like MFS transporter